MYCSRCEKRATEFFAAFAGPMCEDCIIELFFLLRKKPCKVCGVKEKVTYDGTMFLCGECESPVKEVPYKEAKP